MRISDWSSDVCSSDLSRERGIDPTLFDRISSRSDDRRGGYEACGSARTVRLYRIGRRRSAGIRILAAMGSFARAGSHATILSNLAAHTAHVGRDRAAGPGGKRGGGEGIMIEGTGETATGATVPAR